MRLMPGRWARYLAAVTGSAPKATRPSTWVPPDPKNYPGLSIDGMSPPSPPPRGLVHASYPNNPNGTMCNRALGGDDVTNRYWVNTTCRDCLARGGTNPYVVWRLKELGARPAVDKSRYPHACPKCGGPAYVGFTSTDCAGGCR